MKPFALHIVIVTYNNRWDYLNTNLTQLENCAPDSSVVVVNNGGDVDLSKNLSKYKFSSLEIINSSSNRGSAWAFKVGIQSVLNTDRSDLIFLLDDDNLIAPDAIKILTDNFTQYSSHYSFDGFALMAIRLQRNYLTAVAAGASVDSHFPQANEFLGFGIRQVRNKFLIGKTNSTAIKRGIRIPCAPYGGLFFHKNLIKKIGLPDERFFVYADDFEFTYRISKSGGGIFLIPNGKISDIEESWQARSSESVFRPKFLFPENNLTYIAVRNFVYFQKQNLVTNQFYFWVNKSLYTLILLLIAIFTFRMGAFKRFRKAVNDGIKGVFDNKFYLN